MLGKRLYLLLEKFSKREQEQLDRFMESAFFTSRTERKLYQAIQAYQPNYPAIDPNILFSEIFPEEVYNYKKIKDLYSDLVKKVELFLSVNYLKNDKYQLKKLQALAYRKRGDAENFDKASAAVFKELDKELDLSTSFEKLAIYNHNHYFPFETKKAKGHPDLLTINNFLDRTFIINKLRFFCEILSAQKFYNKTRELPFEQEVLLMANKLKNTNPLIEIYLGLIELIKTQDGNQFLATQKLYFEIQANLNLPESAVIQTLLLNFTINKYLERDTTYLNYQFELYKIGIENDLFSIFTDFNYSQFLNIALFGIKLNQLDFVKSLLETKSNLLPKKIRQACKDLVNAYYYFAEGNFDKANQLALDLHKSPILIALRARLLALRCHFEFYSNDPSFYQSFISDCNKFKRYINKLSVLSDHRKAGYLNHMEILRELAYYLNSSRKNKKKLSMLLLKIEQTKKLVAWEALINKITNLKNTNRRKW